MKKYAVVGGSVVLDIEPFIENEDFEITQGKLIYFPDIKMHVGGTIGNTGLALNRLGIPVFSMGMTGNDNRASIIKIILEEEGVDYFFAADQNERTSTSIVFAVPGKDRCIINSGGSNKSFSSDIIDVAKFPEDSAVFHFAYPTAMKNLYSNGGKGMYDILKRVRDKGIACSLDVCPPRETDLNWARILSCWLPLTDFFEPSIEEMLIMLDSDYYKKINNERKGNNIIDLITVEKVREIANMLVALGGKIILLKVGKKGLYLKTAGEDAIKQIPRAIDNPQKWANREIWFPPCAVPVISTKGAGDTAIAGFLAGVLDGLNPEQSLAIATLTAGCCVRTLDSISGIPSLENLKAEMLSGFAQESVSLSKEWKWNKQYALGPCDITR